MLEVCVLENLEFEAGTLEEVKESSMGKVFVIVRILTNLTTRLEGNVINAMILMIACIANL